MSQPPQPPGPFGQPPYGQQPGGPQWGQQPGQPGPGDQPQPGYGQQPGFPPTGPQPQPGWGQQTPPPGWGQPGQPGQPQPTQPGQPAWGQQPGFPGQQPGFGQQNFPGYPGAPGGPPKKNKALPWLLAGGGVVVVGVVVLLLFVFGVFGGSSNSPDTVAQEVADALNTQDTAKAAAISCTGKADSTDSEALQALKAAHIQASVTGKAQVNGSNATATLHLNFQEAGQTVDLDAKLTMQQQSGKWCVPDNGLAPIQSSMRVNGQNPGNFNPSAPDTDIPDSGIPDSGIPDSGVPSELPGDGSSAPTF